MHIHTCNYNYLFCFLVEQLFARISYVISSLFRNQKTVEINRLIERYNVDSISTNKRLGF